MRYFRVDRAWIPALILVVVVGVIALTPAAWKEKMLLAAHPSAARAYEYGIRHIDVPSAGLYDLDDAEYFFSYAARLDPSYPLVYHQLARIKFLEGSYPVALQRVNTEIMNDGGAQAAPYYLRGLIEGYLGDYEAAVNDYAMYVSMNPRGWEGRTDYAWVLIKTKRFTEALSILDQGLVQTPHNPWLMSVRATALFELGRLDDARVAVHAASDAVDGITESEWHKAYPGNAPWAGGAGLETLRNAIHKNRDAIDAATHGR